MKFGDFEIYRISDGSFWLDGGAMFGVVPRVLWEKKSPPDDKNRIRLGLTCLLVRTGEHNILIDTGCGDKNSEKQIRIYGIERDPGLLGQLNALGLSPADIDLVINSHLHFDHCGGNTRIVDGKLVPTFPNATYLVRRDEYHDANCANERTSASYFEQNWRPLEERKILKLVESDGPVAPGVDLLHTPGHTRGHQSVLVHSGERRLLYLADFCPTSAHIPLPWIMGYDLYPLTTLETKRRVFRQALAENWLLFFEHDPEVAAGYLKEADGKYLLAPIEWESKIV